MPSSVAGYDPQSLSGSYREKDGDCKSFNPERDTDCGCTGTAAASVDSVLGRMYRPPKRAKPHLEWDNCVTRL